MSTLPSVSSQISGPVVAKWMDELPGHDAVRRGGVDFVRACDGSGHPLGPVGQNKLGTVCLHEQATFDGHGFGHGDDQAIPAGSSHRSQTDAGIAGSGLDNGAARLQATVRLGLVDHGLRDAVLHRTRRVHAFQLGDDAGVQPVRLLDARKLEQRGVSDQLVDGCVDGHVSSVSCGNAPSGCHHTIQPEAQYYLPI
jgi:hypothetical protein